MHNKTANNLTQNYSAYVACLTRYTPSFGQDASARVIAYWSVQFPSGSDHDTCSAQDLYGM